MAESREALARRARRIDAELRATFPYAHCELDFVNAWQLLVATVLSAQTTDLRVNQATPALFATFPRPADLAGAAPVDVEPLVRSTGFYRAKARSITKLAAAVVADYGGAVPVTVAELVRLPGVGRKTAFMVTDNACADSASRAGDPAHPAQVHTPFPETGLIVDTHFARLAKRWAWAAADKPDDIESEVAGLFPKPDEWTGLSHRIIFHGRRICHSRKPACGACPVAELCPSYGEGETDPEKARKLLKYELAGEPGQRLRPPPDFPGSPAKPQ
ncbi:endonuclease III domain-containing protein [Streptomyces sp. NPDC093675]|uniref:endonuclease III domain-containing protein n=1 Tax=Streptomyces sp. NPDC093675 TaxID=3366049 RepID=UPI00380FF62F